jgi:hypothetical protein
MAEKGRDPHIVALEAVYAALKNLDANDRKRVLSSAFALLEVGGVLPIQANLQPQTPSDKALISTAARPISLVELINEKTPNTNAQRIAVFAYYREKSEGASRFARDDLRSYFAKAKLSPAANFDRDFVDAVRKGWIHEDAEDSYLTTKGIEAVESGFEGEVRIVNKRKTSAKKRKAKSAKAKGKRR